VVGGLQPGGESARRHDVYDVDIDTWSTRADLPAPRVGAIAAGVAGRLLLIGSEPRGRQWRGATPGTLRTDEFDPRRDRWAERTPPPAALTPLAAFANDEDLVLLAEPASTEARRPRRTVAERWTYALDTDWWSQQPPVLRPANALTLAQAGSTLYLVGSDASHVQITTVLQTLYVHRRT
jgi:hypothetical protein